MGYKYEFKTGVTKVRTKLAIAVSALALGAGGIVGAVAVFGSAHAISTPVTVTTANPQGWAFFDDNGHGGSGSFVNGPGTPPLGSGSAQLGLTAADQGYALGYGGYGGTALSNITSLRYSTYVQTGNNTVAPALQINIQSDLSNASPGWQGRLVYEPYYTHAVTDGVWQTWNTQDNATSGSIGNWWFSNSSIATTTGCTQAAPCTWAQVLAAAVDKNIGINTTYPGVIFKAGSNWAVPFTGNVDAFTIGVSGNDTTYNFESASHGPGQNSLPFKSSGQGTETSSRGTGCQFTPAGCTVRSDGTATSSHMGTGPYTSTLTVDWALATSNGAGGFCAPASGPSTITAANGDRVNLSNVGTVCEVGATSLTASHTYSGTYTITGGTGHFTGATGTGKSTGGDDGSGISYYSLSGTISYSPSHH